MSTPSAFEQSLLEMINRARANPAGEYDVHIVDAATQTAIDPQVTAALRYFDVDMTVLADQLEGLSPVAPLAWNSRLAEAATFHTEKLIEYDTQAHSIPGEPGLLQRVQNTGYQPKSVSENVFSYAQSDVYAHAGFYIDWGFSSTGTGIQDGVGHRVNILSDRMTEVGISAISDTDSGTDVGPWVVTQNFATSFDPEVYLLGVVIDDQDGDAFYDIGEGMGNVIVTVSSNGADDIVTTTWASGGYQVALTPGDYTVTFSGGGLAGVVVVSDVIVGEQNVKIDALRADATVPVFVNTAPGLDVTLLQEAIAENQDAVIATIDASDPDGDAVTLTLSGADAARFELADGQLRLRNVPDFEAPLDADSNNVFDLTIVARDGAGGETLHFVSLAVTDVDDTPPDPDPVTDIPVSNAEDPADDGTSAPERSVLMGSESGDMLVGSGGDDTISALAGDDVVNGAAGDDLIAGSDGADTISGGQGADTIGGGLGNDSIQGEAGDDVIGAGRGDDVVFGNGGNDIVNGGAGSDTLSGGGGDDTSGAGLQNDMVMGGDGNDSLGGGAGRDDVSGGNGNDSIGGGEGDDTIRGGDGHDFLAGGGRNDAITGDSGDDRINGGAGNDTMTGGTGSDTFIFTLFNAGEVDRITDFRQGEDQLQLSNVSGVPGGGLAGRLAALSPTDTGDAATLTYGGHTIILEGVAADTLGLSDITFV